MQKQSVGKLLRTRVRWFAARLERECDFCGHTFLHAENLEPHLCAALVEARAEGFVHYSVTKRAKIGRWLVGPIFRQAAREMRVYAEQRADDAFRWRNAVGHIDGAELFRNDEHFAREERLREAQLSRGISGAMEVKLRPARARESLGIELAWAAVSLEPAPGVATRIINGPRLTFEPRVARVLEEYRQARFSSMSAEEDLARHAMMLLEGCCVELLPKIG